MGSEEAEGWNTNETSTRNNSGAVEEGTARRARSRNDGKGKREAYLCPLDGIGIAAQFRLRSLLHVAEVRCSCGVVLLPRDGFRCFAVLGFGGEHLQSFGRRYGVVEQQTRIHGDGIEDPRSVMQC